MLGALLDSALDRSVVGGYTNLGYALRQRFWDELQPRSMDGRQVVVTGATSGLGYAAAAGFARLGAEVCLVARDRERGEDARASIAELTAGHVRLELCDLSRLNEVRELASRLDAHLSQVDVLVNNAGVMTDRRTLSEDGTELTFTVNVLAPFLLTAELVPALHRAAPSRVVNVSSGGMYGQRLRADDLQSERDYRPAAVYARTKRAEVILTQMWAQRLAGQGISVHAMHPGWADTPGVQASLPRFHRLTRPLLRTAPQGADTIVWLGAAELPAESTGSFWHDRARRPIHLWPGTRESEAERGRLWEECERLTGASVPAPIQSSN